ncbi:MAG: MarR family transcriptional regulator [Lachnospiraceae bacterium]|nr:MarR family transcriptional regulator [Lachnospiraceae bacterium]
MEERFQTFTVLISKFSRSIRKIKTEEMAKFDLKSQHVSCLYYLYKMGALTAKELGDVCEEDKANLSRAIEYLETNGYITCESKTQKRYKSPLKLTEKGEAIGKQITARVDHILEEASAGMTEESRAVLYRSLSLISSNLQKICDQYEE